MNACSRAQGSQSGYSMIEIMFVLAIMGVVMSMALLQIGAAQPSMKGDASMRILMAQLNTARELSISQRRQMQVIFTAPDAFGLKAGGIAFGAATSFLFNSDGTLIDQNGNPLNGTVFMAIPSVARSFRAVTVMGGTGRIRGYKWDGLRWVLA
jgi:prepilin-type N-terminal cleavage/methylation domain-containing protein